MPKEPSWKEAAVAVLKDAQEPMSAQEIVQEIIERKLKKALGATPWATMGANMYASMKHDGPASPFTLVEKGRFALKSNGWSPVSSESSPQLVGEGLKDGEPSVKGIVNALGMFWDRSKVDWTGPQTKIWGTQSGEKSVDFGPERGIYLLHDAQGVVYAGRAYPGSLGQRLWQHTFDRLSGRCSRFSWFGVYPANDNGTLYAQAELPLDSIETVIIMMEAILIEALEPRQNRKRGDTNFEDIEFLQFEDPKLALKRKQAMLGELMSNIKAG